MSIPKDNLLYRAKRDVYYRLLGDEALAAVPVLVDDEGDPEARDKVALGTGNTRAGKTGAAVVVAAVGITGLDSGETPSPLMQVAMEIECLEDVLVNEGPDGTGVTAGELVARVVQSLHASHYDDRFTGLRLPEDGGIRELLTERAGLRGFAVRMVASHAAFGVIPTVASVSASIDGEGLVVLACATPEATIHYTLDGSYPGPGNPDALVYSTPISVTPPATIRAAATKTGLNPSKIILAHDIIAA
jgi:hypothetical protein